MEKSKCKLKEIEDFIKTHCKEMETEILIRRRRSSFAFPIDFKSICQRIHQELKGGPKCQDIGKRDMNYVFDFLVYWLQTKDKKMFYCPNCTWRFECRHAFRKHLMRSHLRPKREVIKQRCPLCRNEYGNLDAHITSQHTKEKYHKCPFCNKEFVKSGVCKNHINLHHTKSISYPCRICKRRDFYSPNTRTDHINRHHRDKDKVYHCSQCPKKCKAMITLQNHIKVVHENTPEEKEWLSCKFCGKKYDHLFRLEGHIYQNHQLKNRPYPCTLCNKVFSKAQRLESHIRIHTKEAPYSCNICGKTFKTDCNLRQHSKTHSEEKPFSCQLCHARFKFRHHLKNHFKTISHIGNVNLETDPLVQV